MSAAFSLAYSGPPAPCGYPGCIAEAFHEGEHQFAQQAILGPASAQEKADRLAAAQTPYGVGTRSYNRSPQKREMDRQCAEATARFEAQAKNEILIPLEWRMCGCAQRPFAHDLSVHQLLRAESFNPKFRDRWPWSLCWSDRVEMSTERKAA